MGSLKEFKSVGILSFFISKECIFIEMHQKNIPKYTKHVQITLKSITNKRENKKKYPLLTRTQPLYKIE